MSNRYKKIGIVLLSFGILLGLAYRVWLYPRYTVPILMYHYVSEGDGTLFVKPDIFERQMKYLRDHRYNVISMDELVDGLRSGRRFAHNTVAVTFDDGRRDNYQYAFPVLQKYGIPATIYVITGWMGQGVYLTWDQIREMAADGIDFGAHTRHHVYLPDADTETIRVEVEGSRQDLLEQAGRLPRHFCYPSGGFTPQAKEIVRAAGYDSAATTNRGYDRHNVDLYELNRVKVTNSDAVKPFHFRGKLSGYYNLLRRSRHGY